ncbi:MAG: CoA transferase [Bacteroidetes Order II. Incertae sedis bacterium]|nr:CoA transferase [Bacteroidetes Order II. bacterium]
MTAKLPLSGILILDFTHVIMGPACSQILADMGAEVIHIEPPHGNSTRYLSGMGAGYFPFYSRNKKSLAIDIKHPTGREIVYALIKKADVLVENFGPGTMSRLGYGYQDAAAINNRLVYTELKGFLSGPYENRQAMDELIQMMSGIAYMTGPPGQPLRAGISVVDIAGGMFAAMGTLLALYERKETGTGKHVKSALFESAVYMMGQFMAASAILQQPMPPMPARTNAWSIYNSFRTADDQIVFLAIISEKHWERFCKAFDKEDWLKNEELNTNNKRLDSPWFFNEITRLISNLTKNEVLEKCTLFDLPFAPVNTTEDLFLDPHLNAGDGMLHTQLPHNLSANLPRLPFEYGDQTFGLRYHPPTIGEHTFEVLNSVGIGFAQLELLILDGIIAGS